MDGFVYTFDNRVQCIFIKLIKTSIQRTVINQFFVRTMVLVLQVSVPEHS